MDTTTDTSTVMGRLAAKRKRLAGQQTTNVAIPGYGGELVVRYRLIDPLTEGKEIGSRIRQQFPKAEQEADALYAINVDTIVAACVGFYLNTGGLPVVAENLELIDPDGTGPIDYMDDRLAEFLDFDADSAREAVLQVFGGNRAAVNVHAALLQEWMADTSGELDRGTFGS